MAGNMLITTISATVVRRLVKNLVTVRATGAARRKPAPVAARRPVALAAGATVPTTVQGNTLNLLELAACADTRIAQGSVHEGWPTLEVADRGRLMEVARRMRCGVVKWRRRYSAAGARRLATSGCQRPE
eukprot:2415370-Pleurochrysis_carterae.AAC.1